MTFTAVEIRVLEKYLVKVFPFFFFPFFFFICVHSPDSPSTPTSVNRSLCCVQGRSRCVKSNMSWERTFKKEQHPGNKKSEMCLNPLLHLKKSLSSSRKAFVSTVFQKSLLLLGTKKNKTTPSDTFAAFKMRLALDWGSPPGRRLFQTHMCLS